MKITDIDLIQTFPKNQERNRSNYAFYGALSVITVYRVTTDSGLVGYGEARGRMPARAQFDPLIGRDPFDFTGTEAGALRGIDFELWQEDGSERFENLWCKLEGGGAILEEEEVG